MDVIVPNSELPAYLRRKEGKRFDIRAGAYLIDWVIHIGVSYAIAYLVFVLFSIIYTANTGDEPVQSFQNNQRLYLIFSQVVYFLSIGWLGATPGWLYLIISEMLYFSVFEWLYGATPGKLILKMRVVREDGSRCSLGQAVVRGVLRLWDGFFFGWVATQSMEEPLQQRYGGPTPWWWGPKIQSLNGLERGGGLWRQSWPTWRSRAWQAIYGRCT
jgi:uncharacterized RDD family membrane protein YckC